MDEYWGKTQKISHVQMDLFCIVPENSYVPLKVPEETSLLSIHRPWLVKQSQHWREAAWGLSSVSGAESMDTNSILYSYGPGFPGNDEGPDWQSPDGSA